RMPAGSVATLSSSLGNRPREVTTDGHYLWTANFGNPGSISRIDPDTGETTNFFTGFIRPVGILFDGNSLWVVDDSLLRVDSNGNVLQSIGLGDFPQSAAFDGFNIWVIQGLAVSVVRARDGVPLASLHGNGLGSPVFAAFDGERILVTNEVGSV